MQLIESAVNQRGQLPLPAAHVVLDMRGVSDDRVMEWLKVEVADLASEMKSHNVYHWRYLTDFLSFMRLNPLREDRRNGYQNNAAGDNEDVYGLMGQVHATGPEETIFSSEFVGSDDTENMPFNLFEQRIDELIQEINRVRNNRIAAVKDLNRAAIPGRSSRDATVRVIFLTDIDHPESLTSAALYAERLKNYYRKLDRPGHQSMLNTTIFCLGNSGESGPPTTLIRGLTRNNSWDHIDSLILTENYREDGALISGTMQAYIAELLLYVLLIIPPLPVQSFANGQGTQTAQANGTEEQEQRQTLGLPRHTYVVGLAALEYSARWGKRWLNFGLAKDFIETLRQKSATSDRERKALEESVIDWFHDWRRRVQGTIPEGVPGDIEGLHGIYRARVASNPDSYPFAAYHFNFHMGQSTIKDLQACLESLSQTYVNPSGEPDLQESLTQAGPQILQVLREKEQEPARERQISPLGALQVESQQILGHPKFFRGAAGAIARARQQLEFLVSAIARFQQEHQQDELNPLTRKNTIEERKDKLQDTGNDLIKNLKRHIERWPFLTGTTLAKQIVAILTLLLIAFMVIAVMASGFAWLRHLIFEKVPGILSFLDATLLGIPLLAVIIAIAAVLGLLLEFILLRPSLFEKRKIQGFYIEVTFLATLVAMALFGLFISFSLANLVDLQGDVVSVQYLAWLSFMPGLGFVAFLFALLVVLIEVVYFFWWLSYLRRERQRIVRVLCDQQSRDVQDVVNFIGDDLVLEIMQRAELYDGNNSTVGPYYRRLTALSELLKQLAGKTQEQQQLASERLLLKDGTQNRADGVWLDLGIREEQLEKEQLTDAYKEVSQQLLKEHPTLRELARFILRMEGTESAPEIERDLRDEPGNIDSDRRRLQLFLTSLVAVSMRFAIDPLSIRNIGPISEEYQGLQEYASEELPALNFLVRTLNKNVSLSMLQSASRKDGEYNRIDTDASGNEAAANAAALWGQFFWLHKKPELDQVLSPEGILYHLERQLTEEYDPRAVMRRLLIHTVLFGRSLRKGQVATAYLLLAPSQQSYHFRQGLKSLNLPRIVDFPDVERILLLGVKNYVTEPMLLPDLEIDDADHLLLKSRVGPGAASSVNGDGKIVPSESDIHTLPTAPVDVVESAQPAQVVSTIPANVIDSDQAPQVVPPSPATVVDSSQPVQAAPANGSMPAADNP